VGFRMAQIHSAIQPSGIEHLKPIREKIIRRERTLDARGRWVLREEDLVLGHEILKALVQYNAHVIKEIGGCLKGYLLSSSKSVDKTPFAHMVVAPKEVSNADFVLLNSDVAPPPYAPTSLPASYGPYSPYALR